MPKREVGQHLIVFTRYPEAGKTKTRLIPLLGAEGAVKLHRTLTEQTLSTAKAWLHQVQAEGEQSCAELLIYFVGGNQALMQQWLGAEFSYYPQIQGDLGQKMQQAVTNSFNQGASRVVVIGSDCPGLTTAILIRAFQALNDQDVVIGPAEDGGYYLLGLSQLIPELFTNINWGTEFVLSQTQAAIAENNYQTDYLPMLKDIDRPKDYRDWQRTSRH